MLAGLVCDHMVELPVIVQMLSWPRTEAGCHEAVTYACCNDPACLRGWPTRGKQGAAQYAAAGGPFPMRIWVCVRSFGPAARRRSLLNKDRQRACAERERPRRHRGNE